MGVIARLILGLLAGAIARALLTGRDPGGLIGTRVIGVVGAFLGGWLSARFLDRPIQREFSGELYRHGAEWKFRGGRAGRC
ncbi:GlsB/YeaQ/YmgE family stress response membrane protein [Streptomyces sp. NPDC006997]|uniref:GlsB/YeaQ/YmgE family stress response membrane protein n=1 Tax=Streptomyces sp. NPDC006997 TaxID=3155356 RepID=UPI0033F50364